MSGLRLSVEQQGARRNLTEIFNAKKRIWLYEQTDKKKQRDQQKKRQQEDKRLNDIHNRWFGGAKKLTNQQLGVAVSHMSRRPTYLKAKNSDQEDFTSDEESLTSDSTVDLEDPNAMPGWTICGDQIKQLLLMAGSQQRELDRLISQKKFNQRIVELTL